MGCRPWRDEGSDRPEIFEPATFLFVLNSVLAPRCPVCRCALRGESRGCRRCGVRYHRDCFEYVGKCSIYGCRSTRAIIADDADIFYLTVSDKPDPHEDDREPASSPFTVAQIMMLALVAPVSAWLVFASIAQSCHWVSGEAFALYLTGSMLAGVFAMAADTPGVSRPRVLLLVVGMLLSLALLWIQPLLWLLVVLIMKGTGTTVR